MEAPSLNFILYPSMHKALGLIARSAKTERKGKGEREREKRERKRERERERRGEERERDKRERGEKRPFCLGVRVPLCSWTGA
jgi:hypothetical protein